MGHPFSRYAAGLTGIVFLAALLLTSSIAAGSNQQFLVHTSDIEAVAAQYDLEIVRHVETPTGDLWLVVSNQAGRASLAKAAAGDPKVTNLDPVELAQLSAIDLAATGTTSQADGDLSKTGTMTTPCIDTHFGGAVWAGYGDQTAATLTRLHTMHWAAWDYCGEGRTVAIIDTGIDAEHPLFVGSLLPGQDFTVDSFAESSVSEWAGLDTRTRAIVEEEMSLVLAETMDDLENGSGQLEALHTSAPILAQVVSTELQDGLQDLPAFFGHGTQVAGAVKLAAPGAKIMPLKAFALDGTGHPADIVEAIYYAVDNGADVINMSFSLTEPVQALQDALEYARQHGVMPVAAAGNHGQEAVVYPAAYEQTIGVASTDSGDHLTSFTNYGLVTADLAAPGAAIITAYPGGYYSAGWGTSFSTPMVAGVLAVIGAYNSGPGKPYHRQTRLDLLNGTAYYSYLWDYILSSGRLDGYLAVHQAANSGM